MHVGNIGPGSRRHTILHFFFSCENGKGNLENTWEIHVSPTSAVMTGSCDLTGATASKKPSKVEAKTEALGYSDRTASSALMTSSTLCTGP